MQQPLSFRSAVTVSDATGIRPVLPDPHIEVVEGHVRILTRRAFHRTPDVFGEIPLTDIANVREEKSTVLFDQLRDGLILRSFAAPTTRKFREAFLAALPADAKAEAYVPEYATAKKEVADYEDALKQNIDAPWLTYLLMAASIGVFAWMCISRMDPLNPSVEDLLAAGGNFAPATLFGEWWRLLSSGFVHGGLVHLAFNMYVLFSVGRQAERLFGHLLYAMVYLGALLGGSLVSIAVHDDVVSVGASGALFGIFGALFAYMLRNRGAVPDRIRKDTLKNVGLCIVYNLAYGMKAGIDNWCHVGGLAAGFACGLVAAFPPKVADRDSAILPRFLLLAVLIPAIAFPAYRDIRGSLGPLIPALIQCDAVQKQFAKDHPSGLEYPGDDADPDTILSSLDTNISDLLTPQIEILEAVPHERLSPEQTAILEGHLQWLKTLRDALVLHAKAIQNGDDSLVPEIKALYQKAADLATELGLKVNE